jgi:hypothetical protein
VSCRRLKSPVQTSQLLYSPMTAPFSYDAIDTSNSSDSAIEDVTELCDFCVELTATMVKRPLHRSEAIHLKNLKQNPDPKMCRVCEMILGDYSAIKPGGSDFTPADLKKLTLRRGWSSEGKDGGRICTARVSMGYQSPCEFMLWADEGDGRGF